MELDFRNCKTKEDVEDVFAEKIEELKQMQRRFKDIFKENKK